MLKFCLLLILICCCSGGALGTTDYVFTTPTDKLTARQSSVYHIGQDQSGFMWLATDSDGLLRFDGAESINWLAAGKDTQHRQNVNKFVLDAAAFLAYLRDEPGAEIGFFGLCYAMDGGYKG